ncbi:MAG TPA: 16S rRNA (cytidine(1402)-2'-O)-methyltransferase, partial [Burkholderiales bacterium]|nr:16S rRNA (cytidine(1402)-2'-O)-methyltransferase [Burkholderiales bacterium]
MGARTGKHSGSPSRAGQLYVVATPIGNLEDISPRALHSLAQADAIAAEDTRVTARLLEHYRMQGKLIAVHGHNEQRAADSIVEQLARGKTVALVTDAGTPAISDPGATVVKKARAAGIRVVPIPGPNAAVTALSAAGIVDGAFLFAGFLPAKPGP